ncbi:hypothetical protein ACQ9AT_00565 [Klebsiella pneumoniae]|nr:hypothetical protein [Klebsiella pneumoniae]
MAISKEQWASVQNTLGGLYGSVKFKLPTGEEIHVIKSFVAENKTALVVWIDGQRGNGWGWPHLDHFRPVVRQVWRRRTFRPGAAMVRNISKQRGGKAFLKRKENAHLFEVREYWEPWFSTAASLVRQFKKIDELELVAGSLSDDDFMEISG